MIGSERVNSLSGHSFAVANLDTVFWRLIYCSPYEMFKRGFYRDANSIIKKIGRAAAEDVYCS